MPKAYRVLAYALVVEVVIQAMAIAYAQAGVGKWVEQDGGVLTKQVIESESAEFAGVGGFIIHGINGMMLIPLIALLLLIFSFFAKVPDGTRRAGILVGLVVLQVVMGIASGSLPFLGALHALNAFAILVVALQAARSAGTTTPVADDRVTVG